MSDYESIHGTRVKYLTSDPTLDSSVEGQVWYNSTSGTNKALVQIKAFSSGGNLSTGRRAAGAMGTQTAGAIAGGQAAPAYVNNTEEYNGSGWVSGGNINTTRAFVNNGTVGTQTAGLIFGGEPNPPQTDLANTEEYNGTSWSEQNDLNTARRDLGGCGIQTAALAFGGTSSPTAVTELYDGSSWTTSPGTLNTGRASSVGAGTQTAALAIGGPSTVVESWDGSSWTNGPSLNFQLDGSAGASGTSTDTLVFGGRKPPGTTLVDSSEQYDGSTWVTTPDMSTARRELMGMGTAQSGLACGGFTPPTFSAATEEYNSIITSRTAPSWTSGGNIGTGRYILAGAGTQTAGLIFAGFPTPNGNTEEYNGTSWSEQNNYPNSPKEALGGLGTQTAALGFGGYNPTPVRTEANEYNGTSWTSVGALSTARRRCKGAGTQTAGLAAGGVSGGPNATVTANNEHYNGSSWTAGGALPVATGGNVVVGLQTAALSTGGAFGPSPQATVVNLYDGSSWTSNPSMVLGQNGHVGSGTTSAAWTAGGAITGVPSGVTQIWNGTAWSTDTEMANGRGEAGGDTAGTGPSGFVAGGGAAPIRNKTEEFDLGTAAVTTASTLTTS